MTTSTPRTGLVVDDSSSVAKTLTRILDESGRFKVVGRAADGTEALKLYKELRPNLVCMDVAMPNMDGLQALRLLRAIDINAKVVMITSVGGVAEKVAECLKLGARNVISKPFEAPKVLEVLDSVV